MDNPVAIKVEQVSKTFKLPHEKSGSIKNVFVNFYKRKRTFETQQALKNISFEIKKGEFFGIVGRNGSGKSTLLKMLAGIYSPTKGGVTVNGKLTPFIELGVGFNPELTGRENVFLNGALLGFNHKEMETMYNDIVEFAELRRFMDQKLKNYSSGMQVRLAFSIAIRAQSDILLLDEVLAVGDAAFQQKCYNYFEELKEQHKTVVFVSHDMGAVLRFCNRAMLISDGKLLMIGKPRDAADAYLELNYESEKPVSTENNVTARDKNGPAIKAVTVAGHHKKQSSRFKGSEKAIFSIAFKNPTRKPLHLGLQIFNEAGVYCFGTNTRLAGLLPFNIAKGMVKIAVELQLMPGAYTITAAAMNDNATVVYDYRPKVAKFSIVNDTEYEGIARLNHSWEQ